MQEKWESGFENVSISEYTDFKDDRLGGHPINTTETRSGQWDVHSVCIHWVGHRH